jgi:hypothetical protein
MFLREIGLAAGAVSRSPIGSWSRLCSAISIVLLDAKLFFAGVWLTGIGRAF